MRPFLKVTSGLLLVFAVLCGSGVAPSAYNLIQANGSPAAIGSTLNFQNGTGVSWSCSTTGAVTTCIATGSSSGSALPNYSQSFTSQTSVTLTDNAGTTAKVVQCFDGSGNVIIPQNVVLTDANNTGVTFGLAQTGKCVVNSSGVATGFGLTLGTATKTGAYTFAATDYLIVGDTTSGSFAVKLEASPTPGQIHVLKKPVAANTLTLDGNGKDVDGTATIAITTQYTSYVVQYDGTQWWIE